MTDNQPPYTQLVTQALIGARRPLTVDEIRARVELIRPLTGRDPRGTLRGAINSVHLIATLGGRPARYTWWPRHLRDNAFRQPLAQSDLQAGTLATSDEVWLALWPDFYAGAMTRSTGAVTLELDSGSMIRAQVTVIKTGEALWGLDATPALAAWYGEREARPEDELVVRVLDADERRYGVALVRRAERDAAAIDARNRALADVAEQVLRSGRLDMPGSYLVPRLVAHNAYRHALPPDPWEDVLRADLRFVVGEYSVNLAEKLVNTLERELEAPSGPSAPAPRPRGDRRRARSEEARQAWGRYLFDRGMDYLWAGWIAEALAYYQETLRVDPGHADAWVHVGNRRFEEGQTMEALELYRRGQAAAEERTIGDPDRYNGPFWLDERTRPYMRALHGQGLCLYRLGRRDEARQVYAHMLKLNPNDNQGVRYLMEDLDEGLSWEESVKREDERFP